jgi:putative transposase
VHNHASQIWACDFLQVTDLFFRPPSAFFIIEHKSRKVIHVGVTRSPTDLWVAQHLREATPFGQAPKYLICDHDSKFGPCFARVATTSAIEILKTPYHAKRPNAICERFLRRSHRICQVLRPSYSEHTYGEKTAMPLTRKTFPLASAQCPEALPLKH